MGAFTFFKSWYVFSLLYFLMLMLSFFGCPGCIYLLKLLLVKRKCVISCVPEKFSWKPQIYMQIFSFHSAYIHGYLNLLLNKSIIWIIYKFQRGRWKQIYLTLQYHDYFLQLSAQTSLSDVAASTQTLTHQTSRGWQAHTRYTPHTRTRTC